MKYVGSKWTAILLFVTTLVFAVWVQFVLNNTKTDISWVDESKLRLRFSDAIGAEINCPKSSTFSPTSGPWGPLSPSFIILASNKKYIGYLALLSRSNIFLLFLYIPKNSSNNSSYIARFSGFGSKVFEISVKSGISSKEIYPRPTAPISAAPLALA